MEYLIHYIKFEMRTALFYINYRSFFITVKLKLGHKFSLFIHKFSTLIFEFSWVAPPPPNLQLYLEQTQLVRQRFALLGFFFPIRNSILPIIYVLINVIEDCIIFLAWAAWVLFDFYLKVLCYLRSEKIWDVVLPN